MTMTTIHRTNPAATRGSSLQGGHSPGRLLDLLGSPWAILPDTLLELQAIYATHLRGDKIDIEAIEARLGRPLANEQQTYTVRDGGVAVLPISGILAPKANMLMRVSGMQSMQMLAEQARSMEADPRVRSAIIAADSPGGSVLGTPALAAAVGQLAAAKSTVTVVEGKAASAMYWIGSAANAVFIEGSTDMVGSIGVVMTHEYDPSVKTVSKDIVAGKYKRMASGNAPLTAEAEAYLQQQVDHVYSVFVDAVAEQRGTTSAKVLDRMADGRVFIGQQAIDAGLVDGVSTLEAMVERLATNPNEFAGRRKAVFALGGLPEAAAGDAAAEEPVASAGAAPANPLTQPEGDVMPTADQNLTRESLERDHAPLFAALRSEFMTAGASAERDRVVAVRAAGLPGHEALIEQLVADGKTNGPEAAMAVLAAHRASITAAAAAHAADAPKAVPSGAAPGNEGGRPGKAEQVAQAQAYAAEHKVDFVAAMKALGFAD